VSAPRGVRLLLALVVALLMCVCGELALILYVLYTFGLG
jgi:hypothetical protein